MAYLSTREAARELGVSESTARRLYEAGDLSGFTTKGGHRRFDSESVRRLVESRDQVKITFPSGR